MLRRQRRSLCKLACGFVSAFCGTRKPARCEGLRGPRGMHGAKDSEQAAELTPTRTRLQPAKDTALTRSDVLLVSCRH